MGLKQAAEIIRLKGEIRALKKELKTFETEYQPERDSFHNYLWADLYAARGTINRLYDLIERSENLSWLKSNADRVMTRYTDETKVRFIPPFLRGEPDYIELSDTEDNGSGAESQ